MNSDDWKDIDSAPKDGGHILLFRPNIMFVGYWASGNCGWIISAPGLPHMQPDPTHWMELPREPNTSVDFEDIANLFDDILETGYEGDGI